MRKVSALGVLAMLLALSAACSTEAPAPTAAAEEPVATFTVARVPVQDMKPAFAQVDSVDAVSARARISGTITDLRVREGAEVARGAVLASIGDARLPLQARAEAAQAQALASELAQARADLARYQRLFDEGYYPAQRLEQARAQVRSLENQVSAARGQRAVTVETGAQGTVLAPVAGRVLRVPVRRGGVVMMGEEIALVGSSYILKLHLPERHASFLREGAAVAIARADGGRDMGRVARVYPALEDGRVEADITAEGLEGRVFGERVRVWIPADQREAIVAPAAYLTTRFGVDFARVRLADGTIQDVVVRRGEPVDAEGVDQAVEILSGLAAGDVLAAPGPAGLAEADAP